MECPEKWDSLKDKSVYELITRLCEKIAIGDDVVDDFACLKRPLVRKLRSKAYEILLKKSETVVPREPCEPALDLLAYYFDRNYKKCNIGDYKDLIYLKENIDWVVDRDESEVEPYFNEILKFVTLLKNMVSNDGGKFMFENPFSFGKLDEMLPKIAAINGNEPKPYQHFPTEIFQLPFAIINDVNNIKNDVTTLYPYLIESFISKPGTHLSHLNRLGIYNAYSSGSHVSHDNKQSSLTSGDYVNGCIHFEGLLASPRLTGPRDLCIPSEDNASTKHLNITSTYNSLQESIMHMSSSNILSSGPPATLWELASMDINIQPDLWEQASKLPPIEKRGFISSSLVQMSHWKQIYSNRMDKLNVISEAQFILHLKYLTIGIASSSFYFDTNIKRFMMKPNLCLEGLHQNTLQTYVFDLIKTGTCYWKLNNLVSHSASDNEILKEGFVYKSMCDSIRQYLVWFRLEVDKVFGEGLVTIEQKGKRLPALLEIIHEMKPLTMQIQTMDKVYQACEREHDESFIRGAGLMAYLYNEITMITQGSVSAILYSALQATCRVYFRFIQRFIFEGELEDLFEEFFIKKDNRYINSYTKQYWNKGFVIRSNETVPEFLKGMAKYILLCGKSLRLLKLCNPDDPLCVILSTDYPHIKCCLTFEEIQDQQRLYDQYRTQCLYVCGEPVTFESLLMQKEAEKRAFREMVLLKQAETMEKLIEERKRLSRMLLVNKRKQFSALREAAENAKAQRDYERNKTVQQEKLMMEHYNASNKLHALRIEEEKRRVVAFFSEIEKEVNKRKMMADWKIKRLQLDTRRVELLTSEKVNLSRECLESKRKSSKVADFQIKKDQKTIDVNYSPMIDTSSTISKKRNDISSLVMKNNKQNIVESLLDALEIEKDIPRTQISDIENKNVNNVSITNIADKIQINSNGNTISDVNSNLNIVNETSDSAYIDLSPSDILNSNVLLLDAKQNNTTAKLEALRNKEKVMAHEFGTKISNDNSEILSIINNNVSEAQRNKMKVLGSDWDAENNNPSSEYNSNVPQYNTEASRQALINKQKVLGHEFGIDTKIWQAKRKDNLTLDLKSCSKSQRDWNNQNIPNWGTSNLPLGITPGSCAKTPSDFNTRLDIETPSTFDVGPFGLPSAATLSPTSAQVADLSENSNVTKTGFRFPNIIEEHNSDDDVPDYPIVTEEMKVDVEVKHKETSPYSVKSTVWNFSDNNLNFGDFKPFGIETTAEETFKTLDIFDKRLVLDSAESPYPNINDIIEHAQKSPASNMFKLLACLDENDNILKMVGNVDLSTIATCLQRSVMIPLSYQMEMVNNATLKHFLFNCDLYDHLKNICDFFFLMDGEFARTICTNIFDKLNTTSSPRELLNFATLHSILDKSFGSSVCGVNKYAENLSFIVNDMPISFHHSSPDVLECLTLSYTVSWPLNIIFSQEAMDRYAKVFQFLLKMRRISWALENDSEVLKMSLKEEFMVSKELLRSPQYHSVQLYRYMMSSLIRALHSYISTTCLQSSWKEFEKDLIGARTLDDLYSIHVIYVKKVLFRCLLNNRSSSIMKILNDIFSVILQFHHYLNSRCWHIAENEIYYTHPLFAKLRESYMSFDKFAKRLHKMVTHLTDCGYQPHLAELLSVMNMNDYYNRADAAKK